ncbi:MAG: YHYH protein [Gemmatimonadota bacterium]
MPFVTTVPSSSQLRAFMTGLVLLPLGAACSSSSTAAPSDSVVLSPGTTTLAQYYREPALCKDASGPDCTKLRLGDAFLTTTTPARGRLYSCTGPNPNAPGSTRALITWFDDAAGTWNLLRKPWLPSGRFATAPGTFEMTDVAGTRTIRVNNLPVDGKVGDWPMTAYAPLTAIDRNGGTPAARSYTFTLPTNPTAAVLPGCVSVGAIGVTLNGVVLYNAADARGNDAVAHEIVDEHGGHPAQTDYHYHFVPERLDASTASTAHSGIIGYIRDGFALYGYRGEGGVELTNADLDECHGHTHGTLGYHYHATIEYPYTIGCYRGTPR